MQKSLAQSPEIDEGDFYTATKKAIAEGTHAEYLQRALNEYEWYRAEFAKAFSLSQSKDAIYTFRVVYKLKRGVSREIDILGNQSFEKFARAIVKSMHWDYDHMHSFTIVGPRREPLDSAMVQPAQLEFFAPHWEDDPYPTYKSDSIRMCQIDYKKFPKLEFIFDFGDGHRFDITFRSVREDSRKTREKYPAVVDQRGAAPEQYPNYE